MVLCNLKPLRSMDVGDPAEAALAEDAGGCWGKALEQPPPHPSVGEARSPRGHLEPATGPAIGYMRRAMGRGKGLAPIAGGLVAGERCGSGAGKNKKQNQTQRGGQWGSAFLVDRALQRGFHIGWPTSRHVTGTGKLDALMPIWQTRSRRTSRAGTHRCLFVGS